MAAFIVLERNWLSPGSVQHPFELAEVFRRRFTRTSPSSRTTNSTSSPGCSPRWSRTGLGYGLPPTGSPLPWACERLLLLITIYLTHCMIYDRECQAPIRSPHCIGAFAVRSGNMEISDQQEVTLGRIYLCGMARRALEQGEDISAAAGIFRSMSRAVSKRLARARALREFPGRPLFQPRSLAPAIRPKRSPPARGLAVIADEAFTDIDYGEWTEYWDIEARRKFGDPVPPVERVAAPGEVSRRRVRSTTSAVAPRRG